MDNAVRQLMHQLMTDRKHKTITQQAMMYGQQNQIMDFKQFATYVNSDLADVTPRELYTLLALFYKSSHRSDYNPLRYFTEQEVDQYSNGKCYQIFDLPLLTKISSKEYLSTIPLVKTIEIVRDVLIEQQKAKNISHRFVYAINNESSASVEALRKQLHYEHYYPPMVWLNIVPDECDVTILNDKLRIPLKPPACRVIADADFIRALNDIPDIHKLTAKISSQKMVPVRITSLSMDQLKGANVEVIV